MTDDAIDAAGRKELEELLNAGTGGNAQANMVRAAKFPVRNRSEDPFPVSYRTRDWTMFYFFRLCEPKVSVPGSASDTRPSHQFFRLWLQAIVDQHADQGSVAAQSLVTAASDALHSYLTAGVRAESDPHYTPTQIADRLVQALISSPFVGPTAVQAFYDLLGEMMGGDKDRLQELLAGLDPAARPDAPSPLLRMVLFELVRQIVPTLAGPSLADTIHLPAIRSESNELTRVPRQEGFDRTPINICFTHPGLAALGVNTVTLDSFPDAFRQGMAARSERLRDVGPNAPEHWEGELGLRTIHGYFTGGANLNPGVEIHENFWRALRQDIRTFNAPVNRAGRNLRDGINALVASVGIEILHVELGQNPYRVDGDRARLIRPRKEHFGFRDGLSQPDVDLNLATDHPDGYGAPAGSGTPSRRATWTPVAPGEIFLDRPDETGRDHRAPCNAALRKGSTYLVFRKLEQDIYGFRAWLATQRPRPEDRYALAAQLVGRWPNGTSLVQSPDGEERRDEAALNDFRYAAADPLGRRCPLGAHVRRTNPRDIGDRDNVRHHRILRRGMAYGGRLLGENEADDGEKRGMLFIAINASIDTQFEVIQGAWVNGGEFQGQAGLGRCPLTGTREGEEGTSFLTAGSGVPQLGLPQFVTMRGGDYFFAPGIAALLAIALNEHFPPDPGTQPNATLSAADAAPLSPFSSNGLATIADRIMAAGQHVVRVGPRQGASTVQPPAPIAFVARHCDVTDALCNKPVSDKITQFSMGPIRETALSISRGDEWPIGTDERGDGEAARKRMLGLLTDKGVGDRTPGLLTIAWNLLQSVYEKQGTCLEERVTQVVHDKLDAALRRVSNTRTIDLIDDFAAPGAYAVAAEILGLQGPAWLTEMAVALPFSQQHVASLPREWMAAVRGEMPTDQRLTTLQIWTCVMAADLFGNAQQLTELRVLSRQAGSEMINHVDLELAKARLRMAEMRPPVPTTLIEALAVNERNPDVIDLYQAPDGTLRTGWQELYRRDVATVLLEITASTMAIIPLTFGHVMQFLVGDARAPATWPDDDDLDMVICESERLNPNIAFRLRKCEADTTIGDQTIKQGDMVMALTAAAGMDRHCFDEPNTFSTGKGRCPARNFDDYFLFGVPPCKGSTKYCWGRDRVALPVLRECLRMAGRLRGLRPVAGPLGEAKKLAEVMIGLPARFTSLAPDLPLPRAPACPAPAPATPATAPTRNRRKS